MQPPPEHLPNGSRDSAGAQCGSIKRPTASGGGGGLAVGGAAAGATIVCSCTTTRSRSRSQRALRNCDECCAALEPDTPTPTLDTGLGATITGAGGGCCGGVETQCGRTCAAPTASTSAASRQLTREDGLAAGRCCNGDSAAGAAATDRKRRQQTRCGRAYCCDLAAADGQSGASARRPSGVPDATSGRVGAEAKRIDSGNAIVAAAAAAATNAANEHADRLDDSDDNEDEADKSTSFR